MNKSWNFQQFKDSMLRDFGFGKDDVESVDAVIVLPPEKKKSKMMMDEDEERHPSEKTTNPEDSEEEEEREISDVTEIKDKDKIRFDITEADKINVKNPDNDVKMEDKSSPAKPAPAPAAKPGGLMSKMGGLKKGGIGGIGGGMGMKGGIGGIGGGFKSKLSLGQSSAPGVKKSDSPTKGQKKDSASKSEIDEGEGNSSKPKKTPKVKKEKVEKPIKPTAM